jgi:hypothetical protein
MKFTIYFKPPAKSLIVNMPSLHVGIDLIEQLKVTTDQVATLEGSVCPFLQDDYYLNFTYQNAVNESFFKDKNFGIVNVPKEFFNQFAELNLFESGRSSYEIKYVLNSGKIYQAWQDAGKPLTWDI